MSSKQSYALSLADISRLLFIVAIAIAVAIVARTLLVPIVFAIILSLVVLPICKKLESWKIPRILSVMAVVITTTILVLGFAVFVTYEVQGFLKDMPELKSYFKQAADNAMVNVRDFLNISQNEQEKLIEDNSSSIMAPVGKVFQVVLTSTYEAIFTMVLIPIYMVFLLYYRNKWKNFIIRSFQQYTKTERVKEVLGEVMNVSRQYIKGVLLVVLILAVLNSVGLLLFGIKYALIIGVLSACLNIIPYLGNVVGCAIPMAIALATKDSYWYPLGVGMMYVGIQLVEGNIITPNIVGSQVNINPFIAVIALFVGGLIWGIAGIILAIPLTAIIRVILSYSKTFEPIGILLSDEDAKDEADIG